MFKKLLASMGVGSAEVDTRLHQHRVTPGSMLTGDVHIRGGDARQEIEQLSLFLMTEVEVESGDTEYRQPQVIQSLALARDFVVNPHEQLAVPFQLFIHPETPITEFPVAQGYQAGVGKGGWGGPVPGTGATMHGRGCRVWIQTGLSIDDGVDASDRDALVVAPTGPISRFLAAVENHGFRLFSADVERGTLRGSSFQSTIGCYQEIEYRAIPGTRYAGSVNELEISFVTRYNDTGVLLEIDQKFRRNDAYRSIVMYHQNYQNVDWEGELGRILSSAR
ncbi:SpoOM family protein [Sorangium cellulosum]|uniref:SpoOM family protein n=1 Tax=Sorangium cellulosum TaxID=56 RepID=A0A2L0EZ72_SORCE|nr:sporulation protein [Sorangium cellulosum]AUX44604.1 SpoOM family protein [Sorangium cellulosum]